MMVTHYVVLASIHVEQFYNINSLTKKNILLKNNFYNGFFFVLILFHHSKIASKLGEIFSARGPANTDHSLET